MIAPFKLLIKVQRCKQTDVCSNVMFSFSNCQTNWNSVIRTTSMHRHIKTRKPWWSGPPVGRPGCPVFFKPPGQLSRHAQSCAYPLPRQASIRQCMAPHIMPSWSNVYQPRKLKKYQKLKLEVEGNLSIFENFKKGAEFSHFGAFFPN